MNVTAKKLNSGTIEQAQLLELSRRSRVSILFSGPALFTVAFVHYDVLPLTRILVWLSAMLLIQAVRFSFVLQITRNDSLKSVRRRQATPEILCSAASGVGWGILLYFLDSGALDFLFLFKLIAIAAAMGVTMNAFSAVLPVYAAFIFSAGTSMCVYLLTEAHFLNPVEKISLALGIATYSLVLFFVSRHANRLERFALVQRIKREKTLALLRQNHIEEVHLREKLETERIQLAELNSRLNELARNDPLTGLYNRRFLNEQLDRELMTAHRHKTAFSVILLDIDDFKVINDTYGHLIGDKVLISLSSLLSSGLREIDSLARWGGEEFICLLPKASPEEALACAERLRETLANANLLPDMLRLQVTASFGISTYLSGDDANSVVRRADEALYTAKTSGKNKSFCAPTECLPLFPEKETLG